MTDDALAPAVEPLAPELDWKQSLPDKVQAWEEVKNSETSEAFFDQIENHRSMIGRSIQVPGEDASAEAREKYRQRVLEKTPEVMLRPTEDNMDDFFNSLGRPEAADKYTPPEIEGMEFDQGSLEAFAPIAYEAGMTNKQYQKIVTKMQVAQQQQNEAAMQEIGAGVQTLKGEWGMAFDQRVNAAQNYVNKVLPSIGDVSKLNSDSLRELYNASLSIGGEGAQMTEDPGASAAMTPGEAQEKISEIMSNREHPVWNPQDPRHKSEHKRFIELHKFKGG